MKRRLISLSVALFWLVSLFLPPVSPAFAQDWQSLSSDIDGDGLLNDLETTGWYNGAGGPFVTDPLDADSDHDGLTDGEEKLYDTIPINGPGDLNGAKSPGLYVKYEDSFYTKGYFSVTDPNYLSMEQVGDRYLMKEAMVVRRGIPFRIGGPYGATLTISGSGLWTSPNIQKDPCQGGWIVTFPLNGQVGTYTATVSMPPWQRDMPIYVIFELPTKPWAEIEAFLYNDAPADLRDETAVIWRTRIEKYWQEYYDPDVEYEYRLSKAWTYAFWTDHYQEYVFIDQVMPRIHGKTNQHDATEALSAGADDEVRVNWSQGHYYKRTDMYTTLKKECYNEQTGEWEVCIKCGDGQICTQDGTACHAQAGVFTGFLRSAGIAAKPFITDHSWGQYDTSVLVWFNSQWRTARSYARQETSDDYQYYPFTGGHRPDGTLYMWYGEGYENVLVEATKLWDYEQWRPKDPGETCPLGQNSDGDECFLGGMVYDDFAPDKYMIPSTWEYKWDSRIPLEFYQKHPYVDSLTVPGWQGNSWVPTDPDPRGHHTPPWPTELPSPYYDLPNPYPGGELSENWPIEPVPQGCPKGYLGVCSYGVGGLGAMGFEPEEGVQPALQLPQLQSDLVQFGPVVNDNGLDTDGNGRFDELVVDVEVTASQPGHYILGGILGLPGDPTPYGGLYSSNLSVDLVAGTQTVQLSFDGLAIGSYEVNGPYQVTGLWITDAEEFDPHLGPWDKVLASEQPGYTTQPYTADQFETLGASLADGYSHYGVDNDGDGRYEAVTVDVALDISLPGTYRVEGDLYDGEGNFVGHGTWTGSGSTASLRFGLEKTTPPYTLKHLRLFDSVGALLDSGHRDAYTISNLGGLVDQGAITMDLYLPESGGIGPLGLTITPTHVFNDRGVDLDGDGSYDQLVIDVQVEVSEADQYRVEGWLEGPDGSLIVYALSDPTDLDPGFQTLSLAFDGRAINNRGIDGPYTLIALKILRGDVYKVLDEIDVAYTTSAYTHYTPIKGLSGLGVVTASTATVVFEDDMESGTGQWTATPWSLTTGTWRSASHSWRDSPGNYGNNVNVSLTTKSIAVPESTEVVVMFQGCYDLKPNDYGYVEIKVNDGAWTSVLAYTDGTKLWYSEGATLSSDDEITSLKARFRLSSDGSGTADGWYIDDVIIAVGGGNSIYLPIIMK